MLTGDGVGDCRSSIGTCTLSVASAAHHILVCLHFSLGALCRSTGMFLNTDESKVGVRLTLPPICVSEYTILVTCPHCHSPRYFQIIYFIAHFGEKLLVCSYLELGSSSPSLPAPRRTSAAAVFASLSPLTSSSHAISRIRASSMELPTISLPRPSSPWEKCRR